MTQFTADILSLIFGIIAIFMSAAIEFPQLVIIFKTKNTSGTSLSTYLMFVFASALWVTWASVNYWTGVTDPNADMSLLHVAGLIPAVVSNTISIILVSIISFFKIRNLKLCKNMKINEIQLSKIIFDKQINYSYLKRYYPLFIIGFITLLICVMEALILYWSCPGYRITEAQTDLYHWVTLGLNVAAAVFFETISWPQFIKCMKTKDTSGISLGWAIFFPISCAVCFSYDFFLGWAGHDFRPVLASLICSGTIINTLVLILKIRNHLKAKKLGISEWKYTNKYIVSKKKSK